jgi:hypothetical protein
LALINQNIIGIIKWFAASEKIIHWELFTYTVIPTPVMDIQIGMSQLVE